MANAYEEWRRLEELLAVIRTRGVARLTADEVLEFGRWYRRAAAELSFHRTHEADPTLLAHLNDLVGQCYPFVYAAPRQPWPSVRRFFAADFPRAIRRHALAILIAVFISLLPALIGYVVTRQDRALADQVLPEDLLKSSDAVAIRHDKRQDWMPLGMRPFASSFIMTNNIRISIIAFAGGMTAGLLTTYLMVYNGVMLGISAAIVGEHGVHTALNFWAFVAPHGVLELTAIFISGGAGYLLAYALINPAVLPRRLALQNAGKEAVILMLGVAAMLTVAGTIEGFFSPQNIPEWIKFTVAAIEAVLMFSYFIFAGKKWAGE